jgi:hypothetical protein
VTVHFIVKPDQNRDVYVEWSSMMEAPIRIGSRADFLRELGAGEPGNRTTDRLDRADRSGTTMLPPPLSPQDGAWGDLLVFEQRGTIACAKLAEFTHLLFDGDLQGALRLCEPFEDEERVRGLES